MKRASEDLMQEHEGILRGIRILEALADRASGAGPDVAADRETVLAFLRGFADRCHHGKEEGLYFPRLEKAGVPNQGGPIGRMLREHEEGRRFVARMGEALAPAYDPDAFAEAAHGYIRLLRAHIEKENKVLFKMGDRMIPPLAQAALLAAFEAFEAKVVGEGAHEAFHADLERLGAKYLS